MELEGIKENLDSDLESNEIASTNSETSESADIKKAKEKPRDPKNKSLKLKTFNKLLDLKPYENINEIEEFEFLRDTPLDLNNKKKENFLPSFLEKFKIDKDKSTALLAHSVLFNKDPNDSLVIENPENAQGIITRHRKLDNREIFLESLKSEVSNRKAQKILKETQEKSFEGEKSFDKMQVHVNFEVKLVNNIEETQNYTDKAAEKIKNKEENPECIVNGKKSEEEILSNFVNAELSDEEDEILNFNKKKVLGESLEGLFQLNGDINLKRKLEENEDISEKKMKNFFEEKENLVKIKVHDFESLDYNEEEHILALKNLRGIKTIKKGLSNEKNDELDISLLGIIEKPTQILLNKSLLNSESLKNFKMLEKNQSSSKFSYKVVNKTKEIEKSILPVRIPKKKKGLLFLLK